MLKKISITVLSTGYSQFVAMSIFFITARYYGATGRGIYTSATAMGTFSSAVLGLSIGAVLPYFVVSSGIPRDEFFKRSLTTIVAMVLGLSTIALVLALVGYTVYPSIFGKVPPAYLAAACISFPYFMWLGSNDMIFSSAGEIVQQNRITFLNRTGFLVVSTLLVVSGHFSLLFYLVTYGCFNLLQMGREIWVLARRFDADFVVNPRIMRDIVRKSIRLHPSTIAGLMNTTFSVLILNYYSNDLKDVGYFNFATQLATSLMIIPIVVNRYFLSGITATSALDMWPKQKRMMMNCLFIMLPICVVAYFMIVPVCRLFKEEFLPAVFLFRLILLAVLPSSFSMLMQSQWYSSGMFGMMSILSTSIGLIGAAITILTVPKFHELGAAGTVLFTQAILFTANLVFYSKLNRDVRRKAARELAASPPTTASPAITN